MRRAGLFAVNGLTAGLRMRRFDQRQGSRHEQPLDTPPQIHNDSVVEDPLSTTLAALCDPTRRAILARLQAGPASVAELAEPFEMSQQAVSKHLACLESARLVRKRKDGRQNICELAPEPLREVAEWAESYRLHWEGAFGRLRALLEQGDSKHPHRKTRPKGKR